MAYLKEQNEDEMVDEFILDTDNQEVGFLRSYYNLLRKVTFSNLVKGFFSGLGAFFGSVACYYYLLPRLHLQKYSPFLYTLGKSKS